MKILLNCTDEEHPMTIKEIVNALKSYGIESERKSLYTDIERLVAFGINVESKKTKTVGYYVANRQFELAELKMLVDAVQSSRFISAKKSAELIKKISTLGSIHKAKQLNRQVYVDGQPKSINESILYNVDSIHTAINECKKITFKYFDYNTKKERVYRKNGELYKLNPVSLIWKDDCYYLVAFINENDSLRHYRVDRMNNVDIINEKIDNNVNNFNIVEYSKKMFGMYAGELIWVKLSFDPTLINVILDRFGVDITFFEEKNGWVTINVEVAASNVFLGWLLQFGNRVKVLAPNIIIDDLKRLMVEVENLYK